jgi:hypothetical protein
MWASTAGIGRMRVRMPSPMSTAPTSGISCHAVDSEKPKTVMYGTQASLPMIPKAP